MNRKDFLYSLSAPLLLLTTSIKSDKIIVRPEEYFFKDDGIVPNSKFPLLYYKSVFKPRELEGASWLEKKFLSNNWSNSWRNGIFDFQHYHSITHEVLGLYSGEANVLLGGDQGKVVKVSAGDILVIPAGVGHKNVGSFNLGVVGAYPNGMPVDIVRAKAKERPRVDANLAKVPLPQKDPLQGANLGVVKQWKNLE